MYCTISFYPYGLLSEINYYYYLFEFLVIFSETYLSDMVNVTMTSVTLFQCTDVTVFKLKDEIDEAANRLMFLLDYAILSCKLLVSLLK